MIYRRLDASGDYTFGQGKQDFLRDIDAVGQAIMTRLKLLLEEWWEDTQDGLPLWQSILGATGAKNTKIADSLIRARIIGTENVTGISSFTSTFNRDTRAYRFLAVVDTVYGKVTVTNYPTKEASA